MTDGPDPRELASRARARSLELEVEARNALLEKIREAAVVAETEDDTETLLGLARAWACLVAPGDPRWQPPQDPAG